MIRPYPVFPVAPDFDDPPRYQVAGDVAKNAGAAAEAFVTFPHEQVRRIFGMKFILDTAEEINAVKAFFSERGGRARPFYLPSWRDDLTFEDYDDTNAILTVTLKTLNDAHGCDAHRTVFVAQGDDFHVSRWVVATTAGPSLELTLEDPIPFAIDPNVDIMVGFAHLVTFSDDRIQWKHRWPDAAEASIAFTESRQWSTLPADDTLAAQAMGDFAGWTTATAREDALEPIDTRVAYAMGPAALGIAGDPVDRWAAWLDTAGDIRLLKTIYPLIRPDDVSGTTSPLSGPTGERIAIAFDPDGKEAIAWNTGTSTTLKWYDGTIQELTFTGREPVILNTFFATDPAPASPELIIVYRRGSSNTLFFRRQTEAFATERVAAILPFKPIELRGLAELDALTLCFTDTSWRLVTLNP